MNVTIKDCRFTGSTEHALHLGDDFYEDDESPEEIEAAFRRSVHRGVTKGSRRPPLRVLLRIWWVHLHRLR